VSTNLHAFLRLVLQIGKPEKDAHGESYFCPYIIKGPLTQRTSRFGGVDAVQAVLNALGAATIDLELCEEVVQGLLSLHGQSGDLGLPDPLALTRLRRAGDIG
jgi:hypothetical protein